MTHHDELDALLGAGPGGPDAELGAALSRLGGPTRAPAPRPTAALAAYLPLAIASGRTLPPDQTPDLTPAGSGDLMDRLPAPRRLVVPAAVGRIAVAAAAVAAVAASVVVGQALQSDSTTRVRVVTPASTGDDPAEQSRTTTPTMTPTMTPTTTPVAGVVAPSTTTDSASSATGRAGQPPATGVSTSGHQGRGAVRPTDDGTAGSGHATPRPSTTDRTPASTTEGSDPSTPEPSTSEASAPEPPTSDDSSGGSVPDTGGSSGAGHDAPSGETTAQDTGGG
ncbi:MAG: hypothetical protein ABIV05_03000 [Actinomycetota bacterium]